MTGRYVQLHGVGGFSQKKSNVKRKRMKWNTFNTEWWTTQLGPQLIMPHWQVMVYLLLHFSIRFLASLTCVACVYFHLSSDKFCRLHQLIRQQNSAENQTYCTISIICNHTGATNILCLPSSSLCIHTILDNWMRADRIREDYHKRMICCSQ